MMAIYRKQDDWDSEEGRIRATDRRRIEDAPEYRRRDLSGTGGGAASPAGGHLRVSAELAAPATAPRSLRPASGRPPGPTPQAAAPILEEGDYKVTIPETAGEEANFSASCPVPLR